ncbi:MAG: 50S ribosomal protein L6 [Ruminococcaceae bacterium]|nr:50S ribosomal protein L6 [Oscillospiraceae bacterium]
MSRIGRMPIEVPAGVTVTIAEDNVVTVKGPLGTLTEKFNSRMMIKLEGNVLTVTRPTDEKEDRSVHGLSRALLNNMVVGVTKGFSKTLEIIGVGYKAAKVGKTVELYLGHSLKANGKPQDKFCITEPEGITLEVADKVVPITITVKGIDKQAVGQTAAVIRSKRPPEPYHGKGVKYADERVRRKAGKTGK